ncbi:hypothetical protein [Streptomyces stelliscabiei]|uniref:hypothetical protein n=1 Tax=Streptomyces stelliscabiei TaxID=146820 RepID=UPI002FEFF9AD
MLHGTPAIGHSFDWDLWLAAAPAGLAVPEDRPARPPLVYTSGTTGRARGTEVRWVSGPVADSSAYLAANLRPVRFPAGPAPGVRPPAAQRAPDRPAPSGGGATVVVLGRSTGSLPQPDRAWR